MLTVLMHGCKGKQGIQSCNNANKWVRENYNESDMVQAHSGFDVGWSKADSSISRVKSWIIQANSALPALALIFLCMVSVRHCTDGR